MSNAQSNIVQFEPPQLIKIIKQQGSRVASTSLEIENKKYCVIPFTGQKGDVSSLYITFQFNCYEKHIRWDNKKYKDGFTVVNRPNEDAMKKWTGQ